MSVKFEGGKDLEKALLELKRTTAKASVRRAGRKALEPVRDKARQLAPYNPLTGADGHVRDEIHVSTKARRAKRKSPVEVYVGVATSQSTVGIQQEFGNINHGPQPFMRPAWEAKKMTVLYRLRDEMWADIEKTMERARRKAEREARKLNGS